MLDDYDLPSEKLVYKPHYRYIYQKPKNPFVLGKPQWAVAHIAEEPAVAIRQIGGLVDPSGLKWSPFQVPSWSYLPYIKSYVSGNASKIWFYVIYMWQDLCFSVLKFPLK